MERSIPIPMEKSDKRSCERRVNQRLVRTRERAPNSDGATNHTAAR